LEPVLMHVQAVAAAVARIHGALVLGVLLRDRLLEQLPERDGEALDAVERLRAHTQTTRSAVTTALIVAQARNGRADPDEDRDEDEHLEEEPERPERRVRAVPAREEQRHGERRE